MQKSALLAALGVFAVSQALAGTTGQASAARERVGADAKAGRPLAAHVIVALCDNEHQGIVRVPKALGNGQEPRTNLYWGARYGLRTYFRRDAGWRPVRCDSRPPDGVLERLVLRRQVERPGNAATVYVVADAWDGRRIRDAIERFLRMAGGHDAETCMVRLDDRTVEFRAGGAAHVVAYVGHNGLMDFAAPPRRPPAGAAPARSTVVLACKSQSYFDGLLQGAGAHRLLLTTGLMAPEAYTLDAAITRWFRGGSPADVHEAAARAYHRYQRCGLGAARRLFATQP